MEVGNCGSMQVNIASEQLEVLAAVDGLTKQAELEKLALLDLLEHQEPDRLEMDVSKCPVITKVWARPFSDKTMLYVPEHRKHCLNCGSRDLEPKYKLSRLNTYLGEVGADVDTSNCYVFKCKKCGHDRLLGNLDVYHPPWLIGSRAKHDRTGLITSTQRRLALLDHFNLSRLYWCLMFGVPFILASLVRAIQYLCGH